MVRLGLLALAASLAAAPCTLAQTIRRTDLQPGLAFTITDASGATLTRVEPTVALHLAPGEAAHPSSTGGSQFHWQGYLNVLQPGKYRFDAVVLGTLQVKVGDQTVLQASTRGAEAQPAEGGEVTLAAGFLPVEVTLQRTGPATRVELLWQGPGFRREPIPYFFFGHLPRQRPASFPRDTAIEHGRFLFEELSCVRCHTPAADDKVAKTLAERTGPSLTEIGKRVYPGWLNAWLADPHRLRPDTTMPKLFAEDDQGRAERYAVVAYLTSLGGPLPESRPGNFGQNQRSLAEGQKLYLTTGCAACHGDKLTQRPTPKPSDDPEEDDKPVRKPEDSFYAAGTSGPHGLYLLGSLGSKTSPEALAKYLQNPLATNPHGRMPNMLLSGQEAQDLARFLCRQTDESIDRAMPPLPRLSPEALNVRSGATRAERWALALRKPADRWKELGKRLVTTRGCVNCHALEPGGRPLPISTAAPKLATLRTTNGQNGCLADQPPKGQVPVYSLSTAQKKALATFLKEGLNGPASPSPAYQARLALRRFNCLACHNRDGEGGFPPELAESMRLLEKAENADDVSPPRLTGVGHKLRSSWFTEVLTRQGRARPWMSLRMPQYGDHHVGFLPEAVAKLEGTAPDDRIGKVDLTPVKVEAGRALAGKNGLGCISCHDISGVQTGGTRGPDLATTDRRVRHDWYLRWMHQPQRLAPGTRMPQNFQDGKSQLTAILAGDADAQIEALWAYFTLGPGLPLPAGIEPPGKALVVGAKDRPEVLRTFMPDGAGAKAIAVGFPGGVNYVFDAATCRLGYGWTGNFLDASPVWNNRGGSPAKLLGPKFWTAPAGFPWAVTESRTPPDFQKRGEDPAYGAPLPEDRFYGGPRLVHFAGYTLDTTGLPTFRYTLSDASETTQLAVLEKIEPLPVGVAAGLKRSFTLDLTAQKTTWLLAGIAVKNPRFLSGGEKGNGQRMVIPTEGDRATVIDLVQAPEGAEWEAVPRPGGGWQVLLRLPEPKAARKAELILHVWGLPRDDEQLLQGLKAR